MSFKFLAGLLVTISMACWADAQEMPEKTAVEKTSLEPFFKKYCFTCHGPELQEADVRFDTISWTIVDNDTAQRWQDVLDQLNGGDMPPEGEDQPTPSELASAIGSLTSSLVTARKRLTDHGGEIELRRLNRREYSNTIYDLFGFRVAPSDIPEDGEFSSFDTVGAEQLFTSDHFEKYLALGNKVGETALRWNTARHQKREVVSSEPEKDYTQKFRERLADLDRKMAMKKEGKTWQEMGFKDEGEMQIIFQQFDSRAGHPRRYLQFPHIESGVYLSELAKRVVVRRNADIRGDYIVRIRGGVVGDPDPIRKIVKVTDFQGYVAALKMQGTPENPATLELTTNQAMGEEFLRIHVEENKPADTENTTRGYLTKLQGQNKAYDPWSTIWVDRLEIDGPIYPAKRSIFEEVLYPAQPTGGSSPYLFVDAKAKELIMKIAFYAFRRKIPRPEYVEALHEKFQASRKEGLNYKQAMAEVIGIILASPDFLYLHKLDGTENRMLDQRELAVRLSYFLWSAPPDHELYTSNLLDSEVLDQQIDRMLKDAKATAFRDGFINQWAELARFDAITVDERKNIRFNQGIRESAKQEVREFFGTLITENLPVSNLIDSDFVVINPALAVHYEIDNVESLNDGFQKVALAADSPRGGLMTQTAFLVAGSNGERSSPVIRGALVMEKLLHDEPAPPPPNVPELGSASGKPMSNRELVKLHQEQAVCMSCHKEMDAIGFGLENFDTIGRWRNQELVNRKAFPIDPSGTLPSGEAFDSVQQLKQLLMKRSDKLVRELTESVLAYGLGRTIEFSDADDVDVLVAKINSDGAGMRTIIKEVVKSRLFQMR